mmetsp:Transcript_33727/g.108979  ORF Transcript_33727/g.108979 Transcript_33727/m.108979 type:complete len:350 (-) Transcript_33727:348-1397(-)
MLGLLLHTMAWTPPAVAGSSEQYTVYHANERSQGAIPLNMDTADLRGEMFFDLSSKARPLECRNANASSWLAMECQNPEEVAPDLVISKLTLTVMQQPFGEYGKCNVCNATGFDPLSGLHCKPGSYLCSCGKFWVPKECNSQVAVGRIALGDMFQRRYITCSPAQWMEAPYRCWGPHVAGLTGGTWFSTTTAGWCGAPGADPATCSWRASVVKIVNKTCSDNNIYDAVETFDQHDADGGRCFDMCRPPLDPIHPLKPRPFVRNTTDACWIYCYFANLLGDSGLLPNGNYSGIPLALLDEAFEKSFLPEDDGGCPSIQEEAPHAGPPSAAAITWQSHRILMQQKLLGRAQ